MMCHDKIRMLLKLRIGAKLRAIVHRARCFRGLEIAKRGINLLSRRGSESQVAWKGSSSIPLKMLGIGEINILEKGSQT